MTPSSQAVIKGHILTPGILQEARETSEGLPSRLRMAQGPPGGSQSYLKPSGAIGKSFHATSHMPGCHLQVLCVQ
jgi:hypothetical protein